MGIAAAWLLIQTIAMLGSCAQISAPTGGPRDSLPPVLLKADPAIKAVNVQNNKITFTFNEYVEVKEALTNVLVSPLPKNNPSVDYRLRTVTVKLKDTLLPNTTYSINFGNAIVDINEGNALRNFTYVFSTGNTIDSLTFSGKVLLAETGKPDSTLMAMLYRNAVDSTVQKQRPNYVARLNGNGEFTFVNLPAGEFMLYALKDADGGKTYNVKSELFAFTNKPIKVGADSSTTLFAFAEVKENNEKDKPGAAADAPPANDKKLRYNATVSNTTQDLEGSAALLFNRPLKEFQPGAVSLTDSNHNALAAATIKLDSTAKTVSVQYPWQENTVYKLIVTNSLLADSTGNRLAKSDTIRFMSKKESDYGNLVLRFANIDLSLNPVLQFVQGENLVASYPVTAKEWKQKRFKPGEYDVRILYDANKDGKWTPGNYTKKLQPEKVIPLPQKIAIRANWDNERDINL